MIPIISFQANEHEQEFEIKYRAIIMVFVIYVFLHMHMLWELLMKNNSLKTFMLRFQNFIINFNSAMLSKSKRNNIDTTSLTKKICRFDPINTQLPTTSNETGWVNESFSHVTVVKIIYLIPIGILRIQ